jgi:tight adherence protein B
VKRLCALLAVVALALPATARAGLHVRGYDDSDFPILHATLVSDRPITSRPLLSENGAPVAGLDLENLAHAKAVALAIDQSKSMRGRALRDAVAAARSFVRHSGQLDQLSLVVFGSKAMSLMPFSDKSDIRDMIASVHVDPVMGTALYDAVVLSAHAFTQQPLGGRVILLLTDGRDYGSSATLEDAAIAARAVHAAVYAVGIEGPQFDPAPLKELAESTGGSFVTAHSSADLGRIYRSIANELARTWQVAYVTAARPGDHVVLTAALADGASASASMTIGSSGSGPSPGGSFLPKSAFSVVGLLLVVLLVAALVIGAVYSLFSIREGSWVRARLAPHLNEAGGNRRVGARERLRTAAAIFRATESTFGNRNVWKHLTRVLARANLPLRTVEFVYVIVGAGAGVGLLLTMAGAGSVASLFGMLIAGAAPYGYARLRMRRRLAAFDRQLPDLLVTIGASLKAGHSFKQGLQAVVDEGQEPASGEFKRVLTETALGRPMEEALRDMSERLSSEDFDFVITAVTIQRQVGGSLADLFDMIADTIRQRQQFRRKVSSLTAMGRMSAYVLVGLPFALAGLLTLINPSYMSPLFTETGGQFMIGVGLAGMAVGALMLRKIVSFKG